MSTLLDDTRHLLDEAGLAFAGTTQGAECAALRGRLDEPLRVAIAGRVKAGKSTLLNALVGDGLAPTDADECTQIVTWYRAGPIPRVTVMPHGVPPRPAAYRQHAGALRVDLDGSPAEQIDRIVVDWPSTALTPFTLIDTPGLDSVHSGAVAASADTADAIVYLLRHLHSTDLAFLEAFTADPGAAPSPVQCIGVLARADELGVARPDAMTSAARVADRYRRDPRLRALCSTVVPVSALLAQAGATLTEADTTALAALAGAESAVVDDLLLDATSFAGSAPTDPGGIGADTRRQLLDRLGLFGVRLAVRSLRDDPTITAVALGRELVETSGLTEIRRLLTTQIAPRRDLLKARSALRLLADIVGRHPDQAARAIARRLEAVVAGAHELAEAGLLTALRSSGTDLTADEMDAAERVLGSAGTSTAARLGLDATTTPAALHAAALAELERWQRRHENPFTSPDAARAARVLVRTCESILRTTNSTAT